MKETVKIAGAGISGLTTAINLHDRGFPVEIFERKETIAHRFKGDFQGIENWTTAEDAMELIKSYGIRLNFKITPSKDFNVCGPRRRLQEFNLERPLYYLIQRGFEEGNLDKGLYEQILEREIPVHFSCKQLPEDIDVYATGPAGASAVILGNNFKTGFPDTHLMLCDNHLAPKGYAYLLIIGGAGTIATAFMPDGSNPNNYLEKTVEAVKQIYPELEMHDIKKFGTYGSFTANNIYKQENKIYVGEAAGLQDFLFGFGLRYAMRSGYLAALSIAEKLDYEKLASESFSDTVRASLVNRFLYEKLDNPKYDFMINRLSLVKDLAGFLRKRYNFSLKRRLLYPVARFKMQK